MNQLIYFLLLSAIIMCMNLTHLLSPLWRKSFQSLEQLSADMSLSQTSFEPSHTPSLEARPTSTRWPHRGMSPPASRHCCQQGLHSSVRANHAYHLLQIKRKLPLWEVCAAPWPLSLATSLWRAWSPASVWPVLQLRSAAQASLLHRK